MPKARKVLGVSKPGPGFHWFNMVVDGMNTLNVDDNAVVWTVNDDAEETTVVIKRSWQKLGDDKYLKVKRAKVVGPKHHIANLMSSLGMGTPEYSSGPHWQKEEDMY
jgi:hypothetical protein